MRTTIVAAMAAAVLGACGGDDDSSAAAGGGSGGGSSGAPSISGQPATAVKVSESYSFSPTASDPNGDPLQFSVSNLPPWASFDPATGRISGQPQAQHIGSYANVVVRVSDGSNTVSLTPFTIVVTDLGTGSVTLSWIPPTSNEDGSPLPTVAGYRIYYGQAADNLTTRLEVNMPGITRYVVENLTPATYYFAITAFNGVGVESDLSNVVSKAVN
jgi:hypothetical protein